MNIKKETEVDINHFFTIRPVMVLSNQIETQRRPLNKTILHIIQEWYYIDPVISSDITYLSHFKGWPVRGADCLENVGTSTSHNPMGLHGLLQGQLYLFYQSTLKIYLISWHVSAEFPPSLGMSNLLACKLLNVSYCNTEMWLKGV
jgi:hypothetical protein